MKRFGCLVAAMLLMLNISVFARTGNSMEYEYFMMIKDYLKDEVRYDMTDEEMYLSALREIMNRHPDVYEAALSGMLSGVDENSGYQTADEAARFSEHMMGGLVGIGVEVMSEDGYLFVTRPIPGSPATVAGVKTGDIILRANGVNLYGMDQDTAISYIRGEAGTLAVVEILRDSSVLTFEIIREAIEINPVECELYPELGVAHVTLVVFNGFTGKYLTEALQRVDEAGIKNVIFDLRGNAGGLLSEAVAVASCFVPNEALIVTEDFKDESNNEKFYSTLKEKKYNLVLLVDERSASASEIVAGAVRDNRAGILVGKNTYGKGTVQTMVSLYYGGSIKYTIAYYLTPSGENIHKKGIMPDKVVENGTKDIDMSGMGVFGFDTVFRVGDKGEQVRSAKKMLAALGLFGGDVSSDVYTEGLAQAVSRFQTVAELFPYGVLDITTQLRLYNDTCDVKLVVDKQLEYAFDVFEGKTEFGF